MGILSGSSSTQVSSLRESHKTFEQVFLQNTYDNTNIDYRLMVVKSSKMRKMQMPSL